MDNIVNKILYEKVKEQAKKKFKRYPSAYASMWMQKEYQSLGGKYKNPKPKKGNTTKWLEEEWVQVLPYLKNGEKIACGSQNKDTKVCRPLKKIDSKTPITLKELLKIHSKKDLLELANKKNKNMKGRVYWKSLKFIQSK
tara:strand:+ start:26 stop:445 length:420 start_codon:yes stop_codon:yes gene_type:complete